uniref:Uncharacterized protein n=1 Tax=Arundo donax TaxID=35708 RepID=A0A0A9A389_ARUDO
MFGCIPVIAAQSTNAWPDPERVPGSCPLAGHLLLNCFFFLVCF